MSANQYFKCIFSLQDGNNIIEEEELDGFVKDLMDLVRKVVQSLFMEKFSFSFDISLLGL